MGQKTELCTKCGEHPANHLELHTIGEDQNLCCKCHLEGGGAPASWHLLCMETYNAKNPNPKYIPKKPEPMEVSVWAADFKDNTDFKPCEYARFYYSKKVQKGEIVKFSSNGQYYIGEVVERKDAVISGYEYKCKITKTEAKEGITFNTEHWEHLREGYPPETMETTEQIIKRGLEYKPVTSPSCSISVPIPDIHGVFFVLKDNSIRGQADTTRLDSLVWYKRLWAKINSKYRGRYIDIKPMIEHILSFYTPNNKDS